MTAWSRRFVIVLSAVIVAMVGTLAAEAKINVNSGEKALDGLAEEAANVPVPGAPGQNDGDGENEGSQAPPQSDVYVTSRELGVDSKYRCGDHPEGDDVGWAAACTIDNLRCQVQDMVAEEGEGYLATEQVRIDNRSGNASEELLDFDCRRRGGAPAEGSGSEPVVITLTREDFESMPVEPLVASAGPADGWLPVNMVNVLYAEGEAQMMDMELLDTPVQVRATPVLYDWDLWGGNTISTT